MPRDQTLSGQKLYREMLPLSGDRHLRQPDKATVRLLESPHKLKFQLPTTYF
jgi:hypothetical protein